MAEAEQKPHWTLPRGLVALVCAMTTVGALAADLLVPKTASEHLLNAIWRPHAKFHDAQYIVMSMLIGVMGLVLLARKKGELKLQFRFASALAATPWLGMFGALLFPGTAAHDPEFDALHAKVLGLDEQLLVAVVLLSVLAVANVLQRKTP